MIPERDPECENTYYTTKNKQKCSGEGLFKRVVDLFRF